MSTLWTIPDKKGLPVEVTVYEPSQRQEVMELFREGYPHDFGRIDLKAIEFALDAIEKGGLGFHFFLAMRRKRVVGAVQFHPWMGLQDTWKLSYPFVKESMQERGIGPILISAVEEFLADKARLIFAICARFVPSYANPLGFWLAIGYQEWGELPGYYNDVLGGIFLMKRNPDYPIGSGIPENEGWDRYLIDARTGKKVSRKRYEKTLHSLKPVPVSNWGLRALLKE